MNGEQLEELRKRLAEGKLQSEDYESLAKLLDLVVKLQCLVKKRTTGILKLLRMIFGQKTEKLEKKRNKDHKSSSGNPSPKTKGRNGRDDYPGASTVCVNHDHFKEGDPCPECHKGKLRESEPGVEYAWIGQSPLSLTIYLLQRLVCNFCKFTVTAPLPPEAKVKTVDDSADEYTTARADANAAANATVVLMRFQYGVPNYRLAQIQGHNEIPLPESTQNQMALQVFASGIYIFEALITIGAQGDLFQNDDTRARILEVFNSCRKMSKMAKVGRISQRTSIIIAHSTNGEKIALYFTGSALAGENLAWVLSERDENLPIPKLVCDGSSHNHPKGYDIEIGNCLGHARRKFYDLSLKGHDLDDVLSLFAQIYVNDAQTKIFQMNDQKRLEFHQKHSTELMTAIKNWMKESIDNKKIEANSDLGGVINYCLARWDKLTLFLRRPGIPITNDLAEHLIKNPAVRHRKASLHYKTLDGALRGDIFMSLIATCELHKVNTLHYLTLIQEYRSDVIASPHLWLPWNYLSRFEKLKPQPSQPLPDKPSG